MMVIATEKIFPVFWKAIYIFYSKNVFVGTLYYCLLFIFHVVVSIPELQSCQLISLKYCLLLVLLCVCFFRKEICHLWLIQTFFLLCIACRVLRDVLMEKFHLGLNSPKSPHLCTTLSGGTLFSFPSTLRNFFDESGVRYWSMPIVISLGVILLHYFFRVTAVDFPLSLCLI